MDSLHPGELEDVRAAFVAAGDPDTWLDNESWDEDQTHALIVAIGAMARLLAKEPCSSWISEGGHSYRCTKERDHG